MSPISFCGFCRGEKPKIPDLIAARSLLWLSERHYIPGDMYVNEREKRPRNASRILRSSVAWFATEAKWRGGVFSTIPRDGVRVFASTGSGVNENPSELIVKIAMSISRRHGTRSGSRRQPRAVFGAPTPSSEYAPRLGGQGTPNKRCLSGISDRFARPAARTNKARHSFPFGLLGKSSRPLIPTTLLSSLHSLHVFTLRTQSLSPDHVLQRKRKYKKVSSLFYPVPRLKTTSTSTSATSRAGGVF